MPLPNPTTALFFARRFLRATSDDAPISTMVLVCFLSIFISTFALTLVVAVMSGFEKATHEKMQGIHADVIISSNEPLDYPKIKAAISVLPGIKALAPRALAPVLITQSTATHNGEMQGTLVTLIGIDPLTEPSVTALKKMITPSKKIATTTNLPELLNNNTLLIGDSLAKAQGYNLDDLLTVSYLSEDSNSGYQKQPVFISALFKTGIEDIDAHIVFTNLNFFNTLLPDEGIKQIGIALDGTVPAPRVIKQLKEVLGLEVYSWKDLYAALVSALLLEKYVMFLILALVVLVASMSMISLLYMLIVQKEPEIALLLSMGMNYSTLLAIFVLLGQLIVMSAAALGIVAAYGVGYLLKYYIPIELPDVYYVTHLPVHMTLSLAILIFVLVVFLSFFALWLPTRQLKKLNIARTFRKFT